MKRPPSPPRPRQGTPRPWALVLVFLFFAGASPAGAQAARDSARAAYARGMAELARGEAHIPSPGGLLRGVTIWQDLLSAVGKDYAARARKDFRAALSFDPSFLDAAVQLGQLALSMRDPDELTEAAAALSPLDTATSASGNALRVAAEVALARSDAARAQRLAAAYAAAPGVDRSLARLQEARAAFLRGDEESGAKLYQAGLDSLTDAASQAYLLDLGPLAEEARAVGWDHMWVEARARWLRREWFELASPAHRTPAEVLAAHYRRLRYALDHYPRTSRRAVTGVNPDVLPHDIVPGLDDRGIIFVRHGEPDEVVSVPVSDCMPHESWRYGEGGSRRVLHFVALNRATEFLLVANPMLGCHTADAQIRELETIGALDGRYAGLAAQAQLLNAGGGTTLIQELGESLRQLINENRRQAMDALQTADYSLRPESSLPFYYDTYAFRGDSGRVDVVAALAVPGDALEGHPTDQGVHYQIHASLVALGTASMDGYRADTTVSFTLPRRLRANENVILSLQVVVPGGEEYRHRLSVEEPGGKAAGSYGGPLSVPGFGPDSISTSDIVLAGPEGRGWKRGPTRLELIPPRQYPRGPASLYYELYNVPDGTSYRTTLRVTELGGKGLLGWLPALFGRGADISRSYTEVAHPRSDGIVPVLRRLDLSALKPGGYRLEVTTRTPGRTLRRRLDFVVQKTGP